jgi:hypothetical protein
MKLTDPLIFRSRTLSNGLRNIEDFISGLEGMAIWAYFFNNASTIKSDDVEWIVDRKIIIYNTSRSIWPNDFFMVHSTRCVIVSAVPYFRIDGVH